jgi:hypothetical protein
MKSKPKSETVEKTVDDYAGWHGLLTPKPIVVLKIESLGPAKPRAKQRKTFKTETCRNILDQS